LPTDSLRGKAKFIFILTSNQLSPQILTHIKTVLNHTNLYNLSLPNTPFFKKPFATLRQQKQEDNKQLTVAELSCIEESRGRGKRKDRRKRGKKDRSAIWHPCKAEARRSFLR